MSEIRIGDKVRCGVYVGGEWRPSEMGIVVTQSFDRSVSGVDVMSLHGGRPWVRQEQTSHLRKIDPAEPLKPCPLCGKPAHFFKVDDLDSREHGGEGICCETADCAQVGLMWSLMEDAKPLLAERWNRRATPATAEIAKLRAALLECARKAEALKPHQPEEVQMLDMGEFMQAVHVKVNDPEWPEFQAWREAQAKHSNVTPWCAWQERAHRASGAMLDALQASRSALIASHGSYPLPTSSDKRSAAVRSALEKIDAALAASPAETAQPATHAEVLTDEPLTDRELQTLRNLGNEAERAADEIVSLRAAIATQAAQTQQPKDADGICQPDGLKFDAFGEPRTRYVRVSLDGSHCVMHPSEGDRYIEDARATGDESQYVVADVWLSEREFEDLGEFDGF